ncbi:MAG: hypothetical protein OEY14_08930, partial [Myxococcales bacterium]|nr:hypothetical protein [Myxococcales bacterium]
VCGDGQCTGSEDPAGCPEDCALSCGCGDRFPRQSWVRSVVSRPSGAPLLEAGDAAQILAARSDASGTALLAEWYGWGSGHDGQCASASCGICTPDGNSRYWVGCEEVGAALPCPSCSSYIDGERVRATVPNPGGAASIGAGTLGTIVAGRAAPGGLELLVEWDGWTGGHDGNCPASDCGGCQPSGRSRWWVECGSVEPADASRELLGCACGGRFRERSLVESVLSSPSGAPGLEAGVRGMVIAANADLGSAELLVEWEGWLGGHEGRCGAADCGNCVASGSSRWWVGCDELRLLIP